MKFISIANNNRYINVVNEMINNKNITIHIMRLNDSPFRLIDSGEKTIELRIYDEKSLVRLQGDI